MSASSRPAIGDEEIAAVRRRCVPAADNRPAAAELERRMAEYLESEHVLALASGRRLSTWHSSTRRRAGDEVITTTITGRATVT